MTRDAANFPARLKALRDAAGLSREELAAQAGVSYPAIRSYENGLRSPLLDQLVRLADALGCSLDDLVRER